MLLTGLPLPACSDAPHDSSMGSIPYLDEYYAYPHMGRPRVVEDPPEAIVGPDGLLRLGFFNAPVPGMNLFDGSIFGEPGVGRMLKKFNTREWVGYGIVHPEVKLSLIMINARIIGIASFYVYDRVADRLFSNQAIALSGRKYRVADTTIDDESFMHKNIAGFNVDIEHRMGEGYQRIRIEAGPTADCPAVSADVVCRLEDLEPHVVSLPMTPAHYMYTQKAIMSAAGTVTIDGRVYELVRTRDFVVMDEHKGYSPTELSYFWGNFRLAGEDGATLALNIGEGIGMDEHYWNENCLWAGGVRDLLGTVDFDYDPESPFEPWTIEEEKGNVRLTFTPEARFENDQNFIVASMEYSQYSGRYSGFVIDRKGRRYLVEDAFGTAERGVVTDIF